MVLTPQQAKKMQERKEAPAMRALEKAIDKALTEGNFTFAIEQGDYYGRGGVDYDVAQVVMKKYRDAGWNVKYVSDQRDGDYLDFRGGRR